MALLSYQQVSRFVHFYVLHLFRAFSVFGSILRYIHLSIIKLFRLFYILHLFRLFRLFCHMLQTFPNVLVAVVKHVQLTRFGTLHSTILSIATFFLVFYQYSEDMTLFPQRPIPNKYFFWENFMKFGTDPNMFSMSLSISSYNTQLSAFGQIQSPLFTFNKGSILSSYK